MNWSERESRPTPKRTKHTFACQHCGFTVSTEFRENNEWMVTPLMVKHHDSVRPECPETIRRAREAERCDGRRE